MKKRLLSFLLICSLLLSPIIALGQEEALLTLPTSQGASFFAPSKADDFLNQALQAGRRLRTTIQIEANEEILADIDQDLGKIAAKVNQFEMDTLYQPAFNGVTLWEQKALVGNKPLLSHSFTTTPNNAYITSNFLPKQTLAFSPKEAMQLLGTFFEAMDSEMNEAMGYDASDGSLASLQTLLTLFASTLNEESTWADLIGNKSLSSYTTLAATFFKGFVAGMEEQLEALPPEPTLTMMEDISLLLTSCIVNPPVITNIDTYPLGTIMMQIQLNKEALTDLVDAVAAWYANENVIAYCIAPANMYANLIDADEISPEEFAQVIEYTFDQLQYLIDESLAGPISISCWYHTTSQWQTVFDQVTITLPLYFNTDDSTPIYTAFLEYVRQEEQPATSYRVSLGAFHDTSKLSINGVFTPQHITANDGITTQREASIGLSLNMENKTFGQYDLKDQITLSILQTQSTTDKSEHETLVVDFALSALPNEDEYIYFFDTNGSIQLMVDTTSQINQTNDITTATTTTLTTQGDFGDEDRITVKKAITSSAPKKVFLPNATQVTRLGNMNVEEIAHWYQDHQESILKAITNFNSFFDLAE